MTNLYREIVKSVEDIRALKSFVIFEGSKFINKIIKSSSDKEFIEFLKSKLQPIETTNLPEKRSVIDKIFGKRPEIKPLNINSVTPDIFNRITSAIEEWNAKNENPLNDEKFKLIRVFAEKLKDIEVTLLNTYKDSKICDQFKKEKKSFNKNLEVNKNKSDLVSNSTQEFNPQDEVEKVPERDEESKKTTSAKPKNKKQLDPVLSQDQIEKIQEENANKLLEEIMLILNSSTKLNNNPALKEWLDNTIGAKRKELMFLLKSFIHEKKEKSLKNEIVDNIKQYDETENATNIYNIKSLLEL
jgi:hypothetical protein